jgi:hypothetical protein
MTSSLITPHRALHTWSSSDCFSSSPSPWAPSPHHLDHQPCVRSSRSTSSFLLPHRKHRHLISTSFAYSSNRGLLQHLLPHLSSALWPLWRPFLLAPHTTVALSLTYPSLATPNAIVPNAFPGLAKSRMSRPIAWLHRLRHRPHYDCVNTSPTLSLLSSSTPYLIPYNDFSWDFMCHFLVFSNLDNYGDQDYSMHGISTMTTHLPTWLPRHQHKGLSSHELLSI